MQTSSSRLKDIFTRAVEFDSTNERNTFVREACNGDSHLLEEVLALLTAHRDADQFLSDYVPAADDPRPEHDPQDAVGTQIGPYILREMLGEGGMGLVYVAEQTEPLRRMVALKIIKPGMASRQVIARFESERQALAVLSHPNIARIFDAGTTDAGRPYFVMELVRGIPLHKFCDLHTLTIRQRLELFCTVCHAVQHSHLKGIIHRDLKPNNVLVENQNGDAVPKVIDFGIAKVLDHQSASPSSLTQCTQFLGTPDYMSPEQTRLSTADVDTRSDVYSLGAMLYELLTGALPFQTSGQDVRDWDEIRRIIREDVPPRPSRRFNSLGEQQRSEIAAARKAKPKQLALSLRRELDWIVMKALEKEPTRRYESAIEFVRDIQRYLNNERVEACPPSVKYRLRKVVAQHRTMVFASALLLIAIVAGSVTSLIYARRAHDAAAAANDATAHAEEQARAARRANSRAEQLLYATDIKLAHQFWRDGDLGSYHEVLDRYADSGDNGAGNLRGFEWWLLRDMGQVDFQTLATSPEQGCLVRYSPDGRSLVLGWTDGSVEVRDAATLEEKMTFDGDGYFVYGCDFHPRENILATITDDGAIRLWDLDQQVLLRTIRALDRHGHRVFFSADGSTLASSGEEGRVRFWDTRTGQAAGEISGFSDMDHHGVERRMDCAPARDRLAISDGNGLAGIYEFQSRRRHCELESLSNLNAPRCFRFSHDGRLLAAGCADRSVYLWDVESGRLLTSFAGHRDDILDLAFHPDGARLASSDRDGIVRLWTLRQDSRTDSLTDDRWPAAFRAHDDRVLSLDFSADGSRLITGSRDCSFRTQLGRQRHVQRTLENVASPHAAFVDHGTKVLIAGVAGLDEWDPETDQRQVLHSYAESATALAVDRDGQHALTVHQEGTFNLWDLSRGDLVCTQHRPLQGITFADMSGDGQLVSVSGFNEHGVELLRVVPPVIAPLHVVAEHHEGAWLAPDGDLLITHHLNDLFAIDPVTGHVMQSFSGHRNSVRDVAFTADQRRIASGARDRTVRIWDVADGTLLHTIRAHAHPINSVALSPDGRTVASGDEQGNLAFSHVATGKSLFRIQFAAEGIDDLKFAPDGRRLLICQRNRVVVLSVHADAD